MLTITARIAIPEEELSIQFARSSGPGGQNVNKVSSKAQLRWPVVSSPSLPEDVRQRFLARYRNRLTTAGELLIVSQRFRDAPRNAEDCREKLRAMVLAVLTPPKARRPTKPSGASVRRRLDDKRSHAEKKQRRRQRPGIQDD